MLELLSNHENMKNNIQTSSVFMQIQVEFRETRHNLRKKYVKGLEKVEYIDRCVRSVEVHLVFYQNDIWLFG